jgi:hypothetical protein
MQPGSAQTITVSPAVNVGMAVTSDSSSQDATAVCSHTIIGYERARLGYSLVLGFRDRSSE